MRRSVSLSISRAQLMSSSGTLISERRAHLMRSAQCSSTAARGAALSSPRIKNGPICSRGSAANSRTTGSALLAIGQPPHAAEGVTYSLRPHRAAGFHLLIDVLRQVADDALVLLARHQRQALP